MFCKYLITSVLGDVWYLKKDAFFIIDVLV